MFENIKKILDDNNDKMTKSKKVKVPEIVSYEDDKYLLETLIDRDDNDTPKLFLYDKESGDITFEKELSLKWTKYKAIKQDNSLIVNGTLLFCSSFAEWYLWGKQELLQYIKNFIQQYIDCSEEFLVIASHYVLFSYFYKDYQAIPYLRVIWDYGSGKSQLLNVVWKLCYNPMVMNGSASLATTFRVMEKVKWTLIYDEADVKGSDTTNDFIKILNNGYQKWMPVLRAEWDEFEPTAFNVFCPKVIGGRMEFQDKATESRCLTEIMKATKRTDIKEINNEFLKKAEHIRNMCFSYKLAHLEKGHFNSSYNLEGLEPRLKQILKPLLTTVDNTEEAKRVIDKMLQFQEGLVIDRQHSFDWVVFNIIHESFQWWSPKIGLTTIVSEITENPNYYFRSITPRAVGSLLRQNGLHMSRASEWMILEYDKNLNELELIFQRYSFLQEAT